MPRIVLAHGLLGFGSILPQQPWSYFNGIPRLYQSLGHEILCPSVPPLGSIEARSQALERQIEDHWPNSGGQPIYVLAHSMGGLDCRRMLARSSAMALRVKRLITVATPHFGSPTADAVLHPGFLLLPSLIKPFADYFSDDTGALEDLKIRHSLQDPSVQGVDYLCIGCDAASVHPPSTVFTITSVIGQFGNSANDGVVSLASASNANDPAKLFQTWSVDHGGAIGWPSGGIPPQTVSATAHPPADHLERYRNLLLRLLA